MHAPKKCLIAVLFVVAVGLSPATALAQTELIPTADTYTDANAPTVNHGSDQYLLLASDSVVACQPNTYIWLKYAIPAVTSITGGNLTISLSTYGSGSAGLELRSSADSTWEEAGLGGITWDTQPGLDMTVLATFPTASVGTIVVFESAALTSYLDSHRNQTVSFIVRVDCSQPSTTSFSQDFESKECPLGADAVLNLTYPTAVTLTSFTTTSLPGAIRLDWETASEAGLLGFNLYRAPSPGSTPELLNDSPIQAQGVAATYDYLDSTARAGNTYYYWIDLVDFGGIPTRYGPQSATAGFFRIYLPVIVR